MESRNNLSNECQVARDLMPLCADQAASQGSQAYVTDHMAACRECAAYYQGMMSRLPAKTDAERQTEQVNFTRVRRRLRHRRVLKLTLIIASMLVLAIVGVYVGNILHNHWFYSTTAADLADYDISLAQLSDGRVVVSANYKSNNVSWVSGRSTVITAGEMYVSEHVFRGNVRSQVTSGPVEVLNAAALNTLKCIFKGEEGHGVLVWMQGDEIPAASAEMEAYYALSDYMSSTVDTVSDRVIGVLNSHTYMDATDQANLALCEAYQDILRAQENYLYSVVPEWQPYNRDVRYVQSDAPQPQELLDQCYAYFDGMVSTLLTGTATATPPQGDNGDTE